MKSRKQSRYTAQSDNDSCASVTQRCVSVNMNGIPWGIPHTGMPLPPERLISHVVRLFGTLCVITHSA